MNVCRSEFHLWKDSLGITLRLALGLATIKTVNWIKYQYIMAITKSPSYLRFLNLIDALDRMNPGKKLDYIEENLLDKVVKCAHSKESILVGDLIALSELGSQATLHGRLKNLSAMGYIKMVSNADGRKKEVLPTKLALKRYEEISKCLEKAVKSA